MSLLKRKPRTPDTPAKSYDRHLDLCFGAGVAAGMGASIASFSLMQAQAMIEYGPWASSYGWGGVAVLLAVGFGTAVFAGYLFSKVKKRLRKHAPPEDVIVGPMTEYQEPQS